MTVIFFKKVYSDGDHQFFIEMSNGKKIIKLSVDYTLPIPAITEMSCDNPVYLAVFQNAEKKYHDILISFSYREYDVSISTNDFTVETKTIDLDLIKELENGN